MGSRKRPKPPPPTAQEKAFQRRSEVALDREIEDENRRKRLLLRNTLGTGTLLSGLASGGGTATFSGSTFAPRSAGSPTQGRAAPSLLSTLGASGNATGGGGGNRSGGVQRSGFTQRQR